MLISAGWEGSQVILGWRAICKRRFLREAMFVLSCLAMYPDSQVRFGKETEICTAHVTYGFVCIRYHGVRLGSGGALMQIGSHSMYTCERRRVCAVKPLGISPGDMRCKAWLTPVPFHMTSHRTIEITFSVAPIRINAV